MATQDLIHGSAVSYQAEGRANGGEYGVLDVTPVETLPIMLWPGLNASFGVDVEELFAEIPHTPAHGEAHILECVRNVKLGEDLPFHLETHPQADMDFPLLKFITGSATGFGDTPDSTSWMRELAGKFSVYTGVMFEDYKCDIPERGAVKETISGFAGDRAAIASSSPAVTEAIEDVSKPRVWDDIVSIRMGGTAGPTDVITHCLSTSGINIKYKDMRGKSCRAEDVRKLKAYMGRPDVFRHCCLLNKAVSKVTHGHNPEHTKYRIWWIIFPEVYREGRAERDCR
jgi:hypothetical protein